MQVKKAVKYASHYALAIAIEKATTTTHSLYQHTLRIFCSEPLAVAAKHLEVLLCRQPIPARPGRGVLAMSPKSAMPIEA